MFSPSLLPRPWAFESSIATIMRRDEQTVVVEKFVVYVLTVALISQRDRAIDVTGPCTRSSMYMFVVGSETAAIGPRPAFSVSNEV